MWYPTRAVIVGYEVDIVLNLALVRYIARDHDEADKVLVVFDNDHKMTIRDSYDTMALHVVSRWRPNP